MNKVIIANWKMMMSSVQVKEIIPALSPIFSENVENEIVFCPSYPYLIGLKNQFYPYDSVKIGAQDCSAWEMGAFTSEVSANMLYDVGCEYVIIGHSERRINFKESSYTIRQKIERAHENNLHVILCIGETHANYISGDSKQYIEKQLNQSLPHKLKEHLLTIAYEPVWAIGSGLTPTFEEIKIVSNYLKNCTYDKFRIIYGGSVDRNISAILKSLSSLNGLLVGSASTKSTEFINIVKNYF